MEGLQGQSDGSVEIVKADLRRESLAASDELTLKRNNRLELLLLYLFCYLGSDSTWIFLLNFIVEALSLLSLADGVLEQRNGRNRRSSKEKHLFGVEDEYILHSLRAHIGASRVPVKLRNDVSLGNFANFTCMSEVTQLREGQFDL